jgi:hypothetical protein
MKIETTFGCNGIVLISAPRAGEEGSSRRIGEDLGLLAASIGNLIFRHITVIGENQLLNTLQSLESEIKYGFRPIIHFDTHGNKNHGLEIGATGEFVSWDILTEQLRRLNIVSENNLFVFVAACYGFYLLKALTITKPCPFFIMFGPSDIVTFGEVESSVAPFYTKLFQTASVDAAIHSLVCQFDYFHAERMFLISFARYVREKCLGKGGKERRERLLTETFNEVRLENTSQNRKMLRKQIRQYLRPTPAIMRKHAIIFMHSKSCSVSFEEVMLAARRPYT